MIVCTSADAVISDLRGDVRIFQGGISRASIEFNEESHVAHLDFISNSVWLFDSVGGLSLIPIECEFETFNQL